MAKKKNRANGRGSSRKTASARNATASELRDVELEHATTILGTFTTAYVLDIAGILDPAAEQWLDTIPLTKGSTWRESVEDFYGINSTFVRTIYAHCTEIRDKAFAIRFILCGLGCPDAQERLREFLGED